MPFIFQARGLDGLNQRIHFGNESNYDEVVDSATSESLLFDGRDVLDPTLLSLYVFLKRERKEAWSLLGWCQPSPFALIAQKASTGLIAQTSVPLATHIKP